MQRFGDWQKFIDTVVQDVISTSQLESFQNLDNDCDRTEWAKRNVNLRLVTWIKKYFENVKLDPNIKCAKSAGEYRAKGNEQFKSKNYKQAVQLYTQAVIVAPHDSENTELALGYANRSAALFYLQQFQSCVTDIKASLAAGYPEDQRPKVLLRLAQAHAKLKQKQAANSAYKNLEECGSDSDSVWRKKLDVLKNEIDALPDVSASDVSERNVLIVSHGSHEIIPLATKMMDMKISEEKGRHILATQHIPAGDTLIVEKPFAWVLLPPYYSTHCHHCCGTIDVPYPCRQCSDVMYCSATCQDNSWQSYHKLECLYLDLMHSIGIAHLSVRVILIAGLAKIEEFMKSLQDVELNEKTKNGFDETGTYGRSYNSVFWLLSHTENIQSLDLLQYAVTALLLNCFLEEVGFFPSDVNTPKKDTSSSLSSSQMVSPKPSNCDTNEASPNSSKTVTEYCSGSGIQHQVGGLLLRHICQLVCNGHAIRQKLVVAEMDSVDVIEEQRIATAIYPTASLLNHSCRPNVIASFKRNTLVFKAAEDIQVGEEVYNCYGPQVGKMPFEERQLILKNQYFFTCQCSACEQGTQIDINLKAYKCAQCNSGIWWEGGELACMNCGTKTESKVVLKSEEKAKELFKEALICLQNQNCQGGISALEQCVKLRRQILYEHNKDLSEAQDALARCYAMIGNYKQSADLLSKTIISTEYLYGSNSVELANELQKYAEVLCESGSPQESLKAAKRALKIIRTSFPDNHGMVQELEDMVSSLSLCI